MNIVKIVVIYKITSPSEKIYIGSSSNYKNRISYYKNLFCKAQIGIFNSIKKYGWENHTFEIIERCDINLRNKREYYWGNYYNVLKEGLNCKLPNPDENVICINEKTRKKMSEWQIGRKMSDEAKHKMSIARLGYNPSQKTREAISNFHSIPILQYDLNGNFIKEWKSANQAKKEKGFNAGHIRSCCRGERKTHAGFKWKNKNE